MWIAAVRRSSGTERVAASALLLAGCLLLSLGVSQLGIRFLRDPDLHVSVWWPLSGFALAVVARLHPRSWPVALLGLGTGQFVTNISTYYEHPAVASGLVVAALGETLVAAVLLRRAFRNGIVLDSPVTALRFALCALSGVLFGATVFTLVQAGMPGVGQVALWNGYLRSHVLALLLISPLFLVSVARDRWRGEIHRHRLNLEWAVQAGLLTLVTGGVFLTDQQVIPAFVCVLPLIWGGLRLGPLRAMVSLLVMAVLSTVGTLRGVGPVVQEPPAAQTLAIQAIVLSATVCTLFVVLAAEQKSALLELSRAGRADLVEAERIAGLGSSTWDLKTGETRWSEGLYLQLGQNPATMPPDPESYLELVHPDDRGVVVAALARADTGEIPNMEFRLARPDGSWRIVMARNRVDQDEQGAPARVRSTVLDVTAIREAESDLRRAHTQLTGVMDAVEDAGIVGISAATGLITSFSRAAEQMLGWRAEEMIGLRSPLTCLSRPDQERAMAATGLVDPLLAIGDGMIRRGHSRQRVTCVRKDGTEFPAQLSLSMITGPDQAPESFIGVIVDLTPVLRAEAELQESEDRFRLAFDFAPMAMAVVALDEGEEGRIQRVNPALCRFADSTEPELVGRRLADLMTPAHAEEAAADLRELLSSGGDSITSERAFHRSDGGELWGYLSTSVVRPAEGAPYLITMIEDITARMQLTERLRHEASHDPLTGLPNRQVLRRRLEDALADERGVVAVLYVDLDGFKAVNDTQGHAVGDELLVQVADRIASCVRASDVIARLGGDEFAVLLPRVGDLDTARAIGERIVLALAVPFTVDEAPCRIGASIGIALSGPEDGGSAAPELLNAADEAMYEAKRSGKGRVEVSGR